VKPEVTNDYNKFIYGVSSANWVVQKNQKMDQRIYALCYRWPP